jgi:hypothetical protein
MPPQNVMFRSFVDEGSQPDDQASTCNPITEAIACCTMLLRYLLCSGSRPARQAMRKAARITIAWPQHVHLLQVCMGFKGIALGCFCRTRSQGVETVSREEYTAPSPSNGSSSTGRQPDSEAGSARRGQQTEGQPLLKVRQAALEARLPVCLLFLQGNNWPSCACRPDVCGSLRTGHRQLHRACG